MGIVSWIVFGLLVGAIARFVMPGRQQLGVLTTILLGVIGSFAGGAISALISGDGWATPRPSGWIMSCIGAILVLFIYSRFAANK